MMKNKGQAAQITGAITVILIIAAGLYVMPLILDKTQQGFEDKFYNLADASSTNATALNTNKTCRWFNLTSVYSGDNAVLTVTHTAGSLMCYDNVSLVSGGTTTDLGCLENDTGTTFTFPASLLTAANCFNATFDATYSTNITQLVLTYQSEDYGNYAGVFNDTTDNNVTATELATVTLLIVGGGALIFAVSMWMGRR